MLAVQLADLGLTPVEINALGNLADGRPRTVSALGAAIGARPATLTGILDRLEGRGLITRAAKPGDRRAVHIQLTRDGTRAARVIERALSDLEKHALAGLSDDALAGAHAVLRALSAIRP
jgi:MarR family transcriptional regulator, organic hydroperoxide resistance regulator